MVDVCLCDVAQCCPQLFGCSESTQRCTGSRVSLGCEGVSRAIRLTLPNLPNCNLAVTHSLTTRVSTRHKSHHSRFESDLAQQVIVLWRCIGLTLHRCTAASSLQVQHNDNSSAQHDVCRAASTLRARPTVEHSHSIASSLQ